MSRRWKIYLRLRVSADIDLPALTESKTRATHDDYVLCDALNLPFKRKSFDIVLCNQVIEHIEDKERGIELIKTLEEIARQQVILATPVTPSLSPSSWHPNEFKKLGYKVRGYSTPLIKSHGPYWDWFYWKLLPAVLLFFLSAISNPLYYLFPDKAGGLVCIKEL